INVIFKDKNKDFWFSTDVGLTQWHHDLQGQWSIRKYDKSNGIKGTYITTIAQTPDSILWFGTANGLYSFKNSIFKHYNQKSGFPELPVTTLFTDSRNRLWVGTTRGVFIYENDRFAPFSPGGHFFSYNITATVESRDGDMWIGTPRGLFQYDGDRIVNYTRNSGLSNDYISSLLQDREGNIWIGTHNGLNVLPNLKFSFIKIRTNLEHLNKLTPDSAGKIWVTSDSGLYTLENYHLKPYKLPSSPAVKSIRKIYFDGPDTLLLGTTHGLVMIKNHKTTEFTRADGLASNFISDIVRDEDGTYWIGTQGGLAAIRQGKIYDLTSHISEGYPRRLDLVRKSKVSDKLIHDLAIDRKNNLWIGTWAHGLFEVTEDSVIPFGTTQGLTDRNIRSLYIDHESDLWIATRYGGVFRYNGEDIHQFTKENGLSGNWVFTILEDREGNHWFGTANGLSMYDGRSWKNFGTRDGVTSGGITSSAIDKKGRLWFGSDDALSCYVQKKSSLHTVPPKVYIKSIRFTDDVSPKIFRSVKLPVPFGTQKPAAGISKLSGNPLLNFNYDHRSIKIEFAGIGLKDEAAVKYQYKLEGLDDDWSAITSQNIVTYIKLPPGTYTFRVRAKNRDGIWSSTPANASFVIETPLWQQVWFIILMAVIAVSAIVLVVMMIYQARLTQLLHVKHMRDTIATDLHDDIGSSLSSISIFSELARRQLMKSPMHAANLMQRIERISRDLIDAMDDIVWSINADNDSLEDAILRIQ
ncbi:MAG TPA: two-component regulator propeller domain-containing protein, partial [Balneolaceae bacterium]|nr:two-component regulator propeller domain-containing protein [Balneolaceae bacterium]